MIRVAGIDHVVLRVRDAEASIAFYEGVLGCSVERRNDAIGLIHLRAGDSLIDLVPLDGRLGAAGGAGARREGRNVDHLCLRIADYDPETVSCHLRSRGVPVEAPEIRYGAGGEDWSVYVRDPDGNGVELRG